MAIHLDRRTPLAHVVRQLAIVSPTPVRMETMVLTYEHPEAIRRQDYGRIKQKYADVKTDKDAVEWLIRDALLRLDKYVTSNSYGFRFRDPELILDYGARALVAEAISGLPPDQRAYRLAEEYSEMRNTEAHRSMYDVNRLLGGEPTMTRRLAEHCAVLADPKGFFTISIQEVADMFNISPRSAERHIRRLETMQEFTVPKISHGAFKDCTYHALPGTRRIASLSRGH